jgi:signal transduction histidine kinase
MARLFEPFVTTRIEGTGLGLAIVKQIIEQHGGKISVRNNSGAEFTLMFPLRCGGR